MSTQAKRLAKANLMLDGICKAADLDPVEVRYALIGTIKGKLDEQTSGSGYSRQKPYIYHRNAVGECHD